MWDWKSTFCSKYYIILSLYNIEFSYTLIYSIFVVCIFHVLLSSSSSIMIALNSPTWTACSICLSTAAAQKLTPPVSRFCVIHIPTELLEPTLLWLAFPMIIGILIPTWRSSAITATSPHQQTSTRFAIEFCASAFLARGIASCKLIYCTVYITVIVKLTLRRHGSRSGARVELVLSCVDNFEARMAINRVSAATAACCPPRERMCLTRLLSLTRTRTRPLRLFTRCAGVQRALAELAWVGRQRERRLRTRAAAASRRDRLLRRVLLLHTFVLGSTLWICSDSDAQLVRLIGCSARRRSLWPPKRTSARWSARGCAPPRCPPLWRWWPHFSCRTRSSVHSSRFPMPDAYARCPMLKSRSSALVDSAGTRILNNSFFVHRCAGSFCASGRSAATLATTRSRTSSRRCSCAQTPAATTRNACATSRRCVSDAQVQSTRTSTLPCCCSQPSAHMNFHRMRRSSQNLRPMRQ